MTRYRVQVSAMFVSSVTRVVEIEADDRREAECRALDQSRDQDLEWSLPDGVSANIDLTSLDIAFSEEITP